MDSNRLQELCVRLRIGAQLDQWCTNGLLDLLEDHVENGGFQEGKEIGAQEENKRLAEDFQDFRKSFSEDMTKEEILAALDAYEIPPV